MTLHFVVQNNHEDEEHNKKLTAPSHAFASPPCYESATLPEHIRYKPARFHRLRMLLGLSKGKRRFNMIG